MEARLVGFGELEIDGRRYTHDIVIDRGRVRRRHKRPSRVFRDRFGHTPLSVAEDLPWTGQRLIVGTGADGALPVMDEVVEEARRRGVTLEVLPTTDACRRIGELGDDQVDAILHVTC